MMVVWLGVVLFCGSCINLFIELILYNVYFIVFLVLERL